MGLGALIYALINALKKLTHCVNAVNALKKINALTALVFCYIKLTCFAVIMVTPAANSQ